jgi:hypothetical protein
MIPVNISAESVLKSIAHIDQNGIPKERHSVKWSLKHKGQLYPEIVFSSWMVLWITWRQGALIQPMIIAAGVLLQSRQICQVEGQEGSYSRLRACMG